MEDLGSHLRRQAATSECSASPSAFRWQWEVHRDGQLLLDHQGEEDREGSPNLEGLGWAHVRGGRDRIGLQHVDRDAVDLLEPRNGQMAEFYALGHMQLFSRPNPAFEAV